MEPIKRAASEHLEASVQVGQVIAGKYRVDRVLGVGGMGVVVAARHLQLDQLVALKFIRREALANPEIVGRFEREARAAVRLKSEHVARIIDVDRLATGSPYIVMEYLEGQDLAARLAQLGKLVVPLACDVIIQACDAIAEAHSLGIVHRDLKPGNLFLATSSRGQQTVKVLDFGISKSHAAVGDPTRTSTQAVMGSPGYMSPEQMRSAKNVDGRTDVWSLGIILYELVAGRLPFQADSFTALCLKIAMDPLPPLPTLPVIVPRGFAAVVQRALEKDPAHRYPSAVELAQALAPFANAQARELANRLTRDTAGAVRNGAPMLAATAGVGTLDAAAGQTRPGKRATRSSAGKRVFAGASLAGALAIGIFVGVTHERGSGGPAIQPQGSAVPAPAARPTEDDTPMPGRAAAAASVVHDAGTDPATPERSTVTPDAAPTRPPDAGSVPAPPPRPASTPRDRNKPRDPVNSTQSIDVYRSPE